MEVLAAFGAGMGVTTFLTGPARLHADGAAAFYGVVGIEHLFAAAKWRVWYYGDNAYFNAGRGKFYRFTRCAFQETAPTVAPDHDRLRKLGVSVRPWAIGGRHIVVVEQSPHFLKLSGAGEGWLAETMITLRRHTDRPIIIRPWSRSKAKISATLEQDLKGAHALVTHMSAAANEALVAGIPVFCSIQCAAGAFSGGDLSTIEHPLHRQGREDWAARLAAAQWTLDELRAGAARKYFQGGIDKAIAP